MQASRGNHSSIGSGCKKESEYNEVEKADEHLNSKARFLTV